MRKMMVVGAIVTPLILSAIFTVPLAAVLWAEHRIERDCDLASPTPGCVARIRAVGNIWSSRNNNDRAEPWYRLAANMGDPTSMFELGWLHGLYAMEELKKNLQKTQRYEEEITQSFRWTFQSAAKGFAPAMNNLGQMYWSGLGTNQNFREAFRWHMAAAKAHNPVGFWNVAYAYAVDQAFDPDNSPATNWLAWKPEGYNPGDLAVPILERTGFSGRSLLSIELFDIREAVKENVPASAIFSSMKPNARLPVFQSGKVSPCADPASCKR